MARITGKAWYFYLLGHEDRLIPSALVDVGAVAAKAIDSDLTIVEVVHEACVAAAATLQAPRKRKRWLDEHEEEIRESGVTPEEAYAAYVHGRVDELAFAVYAPVIDKIAETVSPDEGEDDDDSDDDDDDSDDDDDDD